MTKIGFLLILAFYLGIHSLLFLRGWQALPAKPGLQAAYAIIFIISALSFPVGMALGNWLPYWLTSVLENIGAWWVIALLYFILAIILGDLIRLVHRIFDIYPHWIKDHYEQVKFIYLLSVIGLFTIFSLIGNYRFAHPSVREIELEIPKGDGPAGTLTLVAASDVHLGNIIRKNRLRKYVDLLNRQNPDVILFAGDLIDHSIRPVEVQNLDEDLRKLEAPLGVYGIFGNHEYYGNISRAVDFYKRSGITLLRDTAISIDNRFLLIGRDDISQHMRKPLADILSHTDTNLPKILLEHNPVRMTDARKAGIDLQISGHTHNGQIFPINHMVKRIYPLAYGYQKSGNTHYYVSSGLGLWAAPIRIGTRSEIVKIKITLI